MEAGDERSFGLGLGGRGISFGTTTTGSVGALLRDAFSILPATDEPLTVEADLVRPQAGFPVSFSLRSAAAALARDSCASVGCVTFGFLSGLRIGCLSGRVGFVAGWVEEGRATVKAELMTGLGISLALFCPRLAPASREGALRDKVAAGSTVLPGLDTKSALFGTSLTDASSAFRLDDEGSGTLRAPPVTQDLCSASDSVDLCFSTAVCGFVGRRLTGPLLRVG